MASASLRMATPRLAGRDNRLSLSGAGILVSWLGILFVFNSLLIQVGSAEYDGLRYALDVESGDLQRLVHPNHLGYKFLALGFDSIARYVLGEHRVLASLELMDALLGAAGIVVFFLFLKRVTGNRVVAIISAFGLEFSFGYWVYSINAGVYIPAMFFIVLTLYVASSVGGSRRRSIWVALGVVYAIAILMHQMHTLLLPTIIFITFVGRRATGQWIRGLAICVGACFLFLGAAYVFAGTAIVGAESPGDLLDWARGYVKGDSPYWALTLQSPVWAAWSLARNMWGAYYIKDFLDGSRSLATVGPLLGTTVVAGIFAGGLLAAVIRGRPLWAGNGKVLMGMGIMFLTYFPPTMVYEPGNFKFWLQSLVPLWTVVATVASFFATRPRPIRTYSLWVLVLLVVTLFGTNFTGAIFPNILGLDDDLSYAKWISTEVSPDDLLIFSGAGGQGDGILLHHWWGNETLSLYMVMDSPETVGERVESALATGHRRVYLVADKKRISTNNVVGSPQKSVDIESPEVQSLFASYAILPVAVSGRQGHYDENRIYEVTRGPTAN